MRITLNLGIFFHDHRSVAKIFINEKKKCIKDVQDHISKIFNIQNFYLKCDNHYLPSSEDVNVLNSDDVVWAIPTNENNPNNDIESSVENLEEYVGKVKKKKKKKKEKNEALLTNDVDHSSKRKKRKHEIEVNHEDPFEVEDKRKRKKQTKNEITESSEKLPSDAHLDYINPKDSNKDSSDHSKSDELESNSSAINVKSLVNSFENKKIDFKKHLERNALMQGQKKINIIKTIIISNDKPSNPPKNQLSDIENGNLSTVDLHNEKTHSDTKVFENKDDTSIVDENETIETLDSGYGNSDLIIPNDQKRKRKRVRKRKRPTRNLDFNEVINPACSLIPTPLLKRNSISRHVRFTDENPEANISVNDLSEISQNEQIPFASKENPVKSEETKKCTNQLSEEFILKQPITQSGALKFGDVIAFKILRISESYTPEISSRIVGKVCEFNPENGEITFDIIYGQEQCAQPKGKFSMNPEEEVEEVTSVNDVKYQCLWSRLLEPRLLFP